MKTDALELPMEDFLKTSDTFIIRVLLLYNILYITLFVIIKS